MNEKITIRDIAGFCPEEAVWKMISDVSSFYITDKTFCPITPDSVAIDGNVFIVEPKTEPISEFQAPELSEKQKPGEKQIIWEIGATAFYMTTGHVIFGGHGSGYQKAHPAVQLPVLPKGLSNLTSLLHKCICFNPDDRITLKELNSLSCEGIALCEKRQRKQSETMSEKQKTIKGTVDKWPEEMIEI
jgi:serine/threonine protein kinase